LASIGTKCFEPEADIDVRALGLEVDIEVQGFGLEVDIELQSFELELGNVVAPDTQLPCVQVHHPSSLA
jgi:hypothetical protein